MKKELSSKALRRHSLLTSLLLVGVAALTLALANLAQYHYSQKAIKAEADERAAQQLENTHLAIMDVVHQTEAAVRNSLWISKWCLEYPDSLSRVTQRVVEDNPVVMGSCVALVPGYNKRFPLFAPYSFEENGQINTTTLASAAYDYPSQEWFTAPLDQDQGYWSEPYVDEGGGGILMTTYSVPVKDKKGLQAAVITADISLRWLTSLLGDAEIYPSSFELLVSREGKIMINSAHESSPQNSLLELLEIMDDQKRFGELASSMTDGRAGSMSIRQKGEDYHIYYRPVERTGWSLAVVIPETSIYAGLNRLMKQVNILQLVGLVMLAFLLWLMVRNMLRFQALNERKDRMEGELQTARNIQMSMIPKIFPPFPEREDIDMAASIVPAKEVGGDLYDFYIRDEKLLFCIGDVSGKGVPASLLMAVTRSLFRNVSAHENSPARIVTDINESIVQTNEDNMFVTFFCGVLDMASGRLDYCNAGHNAPLALTDHISTLPVEANVPLGVLPGFPYREQSAVLRYDDALFLYTDGVTEAENLRHELFGTSRMEEVLHVRRNSMDQLHAVQGAISAYVGEAPQSDDITMLFIHYLNASATDPGHRLLVLHNDIRQIPQLAQFVDDIALEKQLDPSLTMSLNLALEEAVTNVMLYAYPEGTDGLVEIDAVAGEDQVSFVLCDNGKPFDPTAAPEADINLSVEERPIGGLGIYLVRNIMDEVSYERDRGKNLLTMIKKL